METLLFSFDSWTILWKGHSEPESIISFRVRFTSAKGQFFTCCSIFTSCTALSVFHRSNDPNRCLTSFRVHPELKAGLIKVECSRKRAILPVTLDCMTRVELSGYHEVQQRSPWMADDSGMLESFLEPARRIFDMPARPFFHFQTNRILGLFVSESVRKA